MKDGDVTGFGIGAIILLAMALVGFLLQKNGELAGCGSVLKPAKLRAPHGRLVKTRRLDTCPQVAFRTRLARVWPLALLATLVLLVLCCTGVLDAAAAPATVIDACCVIAVATWAAQYEVSVRRALAYAVFGYGVGAVLSLVCGLGLSGQLEGFGTAEFNMLTMVCGTLFACLGASWVVPLRVYARKFEDGHVDALEVSARSVAVRAYERIADDAWNPPKDRVELHRDRKAGSRSV